MSVRRLWPTGGLWGHPDFLKLWSAETISQFGSQVTGLALPLVAVIVIEASAFEVSALFVIEFLPFVLFAIPAGVWVDRLKRKPILVIADIGRAALLGSIPIAYAFDALTLGQLYVVGFLVGICTVFFDVSYQSYLPSLVARERLVEGNSKLEISRSAAQIGGPGLAGVLIGIIGAPVAILLDAISFLFSSAFLFAIRKPEVLPEREEGAPRPSMFKEAKEGLSYVLGNRYLRAISICTGTSNLFYSLGGAILIVYAVRELGMSAATLGIVFAASNAGPMLAALTTNKVFERIGVGRTILGTSLLFSCAAVLYPLAPASFAAPFFVAGGILGGYAAVAYNITQVSFRQAICPERMQGRMNAVIRFLVWGTMPIGALAGGAIGSLVGLHAALWVGAIGAFFSFLPIALSPVRSIAKMPEPTLEEPVADEALGPMTAVPAEQSA
jgi:MFS family permease